MASASENSPPGFFQGTRCDLRLFAGDRTVYGAFDSAKYATDSRSGSVDVIRRWTAMAGTHSLSAKPVRLTLTDATQCVAAGQTAETLLRRTSGHWKPDIAARPKTTGFF